MKREIKTTNDGSKTLFINYLNENYHSHHGAL
ncbi:peptidase, partial [Chryseobacterium sp. HMWF001]